MDGVTPGPGPDREIQSRFIYRRHVRLAATGRRPPSAAGLDGTSGDRPYGARPATASESAVVAEAQKYLGVPYLWGGTDPAKGLDCSGFTQLVFGNLGIDLPRTSSQQATAGRAVASLADARPGDLVFFDYSSSRAGIDHVGIYIGNGKMIAAPQPGESVKVQDVGNPTVIRRVLPEQTTPRPRRRPAGPPWPACPTPTCSAGAASRHGVDASLLAAMASQESSFNSHGGLAGRRPGPHAVHAGDGQGPRASTPSTRRRRSTAPRAT